MADVQPEHPDAPRVYSHQTCGTFTTMPDGVVRTYLANPWHSTSGRTYCAGCKTDVPDRECTWVETGENLEAYFTRLRAAEPPGLPVFLLAKLGLALSVCFGLGGALIYAGVAGKKGSVTFDDVYPGVAAILAGLGLIGLLYYMSRPPAAGPGAE